MPHKRGKKPEESVEAEDTLGGSSFWPYFSLR